MTRLLSFAAAAALAASVPLAAQSSPRAASASHVRHVTITGCLERAKDVLKDGDASGVVLAHSHGGRLNARVSDRSGRVYKLDPGSTGQGDLSKDLGYRIAVTGTVAGAAPAAADRPIGTSGHMDNGGAKHAAQASDLPQLDVQSVHRVAGPCPAGW